ncbi:hypothetical protein XFF6166_130055 [Xanthomonas citri pv. fuscans]|nr:hypothetical protein XFF6166_130055 [Xanthomonas citri pv. fuscans]SON98666.1 hypothetical protein XFF6960_100054 [Xanthomonas citri pv. fuscans]SOO05648.1 hypothetical protein XFF7767_470007 [Xanthomonas citri pv. fuscans]SOO08587.1 hypothetical protein XFF6970_240055 [Xanthomonas citri pv. fuscans]SOO14647.1 hypothetical protein XFF7766_340008 [Xanthomonas citri pv. fuscans]
MPCSARRDWPEGAAVAVERRTVQGRLRGSDACNHRCAVGRDRLHTLADCTAGSRRMTAALCAYRKCANALGQRCDGFGCIA